jgi:sugar lactone lactonase YvrE
MTHSGRVRFTLAVAIVASLALSAGKAYTQSNSQPVNDLPNPYQTIEGWAKMPEGRTWGATSAVEIDPDGKSVWVAERCGGNSCAGSNLPVVLKFDETGKLVKSFGGGMFVFPHGIHVDKQGNVWVTDGIPPGAGAAQAAAGKGHIVVKFSPEGKVLLTLGKVGVAGDGQDTFNQPSDVITAPNGDIFVADGHGGATNARIVKFDKNGKFIMTWGKKGTGPGEFDIPHSLAMDSKGRLFVADRNNNRIQIFDQNGKFLEEWKQFSRISGLFIRNDMLYAADSESNTARHAGWKRGIRIGSAKDGKVTEFIPDPNPNPDSGAGAGTSAAEGVAVDSKGNIYGAEVGPRALKKYVRK